MLLLWNKIGNYSAYIVTMRSEIASLLWKHIALKINKEIINNFEFSIQKMIGKKCGNANFGLNRFLYQTISNIRCEYVFEHVGQDLRSTTTRENNEARKHLKLVSNLEMDKVRIDKSGLKLAPWQPPPSEWIIVNW